MSREIRFRAWKESESRMVPWDELCSDGEMLALALNKIYLADVMQYTGLKDKNGVEIYEGAVVKALEASERGDGSYDDVIMKVEWCGEFYTWKLKEVGLNHWYYLRDFDLEVIGNIYENPELLGQ